LRYVISVSNWRNVSEINERNKDNEYIIKGKLEEKEKQIEELTKKQKRFDALIQSLIDSGQVKPLSES
jgi:hypothetical protein